MSVTLPTPQTADDTSLLQNNQYTKESSTMSGESQPLLFTGTNEPQQWRREGPSPVNLPHLRRRLNWVLRCAIAIMLLLATLCALYTSMSFHYYESDSSDSDMHMTESERSLLNHYYGPLWFDAGAGTADSATASMSSFQSFFTKNALRRLRTAQQTADASRYELNGNSSDDNNNDNNNDDLVKSTEGSRSVRKPNQHRSLSHQDRTTKDGKKHHDGTKSSSSPLVGCETTVVIIRHCEKEFIAEHCAYNGYERSVYLSTLFGPQAKYPTPLYIFAESPIERNTHSQKMNFREVETVGPLAERWHIPIDDSYTDDTLYDLSQHLKENIKRGHYCGHVIVVVWKHTRIAEFAHWLGCGPVQGCPIDYSGKTFDQLWQVRYVYTNEFSHSTHKHHFLKHPTADVKWNIFGSLQYENFDPLAFGHVRGDYDSPVDHPTDHNSNDDNKDDDLHRDASWQSQVVSYPERSYSTDRAGWKMTMLGSSNTDQQHAP